MTLRELLLMAYGRWRHTAEQIATLCNVNRSKDADAIEPDQINGYSRWKAIKEPAKNEVMRLEPKEFIAAIAAHCGVPIQGADPCQVVEVSGREGPL